MLEAFAATAPERYVNVGVAEQNLAGIAAGLAHGGKIVFIYSIANFPTFRCLEQIRNDICYHGLAVRIVSVGGGFSYGPLGYTHHGLEDIAVMRSLPGMTVIAPGDPVEAALATQAVIDLPGPAYLRLGKAGEPNVHDPAPSSFTLGKALMLRDGRDFTVVATGAMLAPALAARDRLLVERGLSGRVLSMHTVKPLDEQAVRDAARETRSIVSAEEHSVTNGLGSAVADVIATMPSRVAVLRKFGVPDRVHSHIGSQNYMRKLAGDIAETVLQALSSVPAGSA